MRSVAVSACAVLIGGCLIVRTEEEIVDDPCPREAPELIADASGPLVVADTIYFIGANGTLSRVALDGGTVSELGTEQLATNVLAADATALYWATETGIVRKPFDASPQLIADGFLDIAALVVDDASVAWASASGLDRWSKSDQTVTHLDDVSPIFGLGVSDGLHYYSAHGLDTVRRAPPIQDIAQARSPGPLVVDDQGIYFYDVDDPFAKYGGALRLVPRDGGVAVTTAENISLVLDLASDDSSLYFASVFDDEYRIKRVSRFGGTVRTLACGRWHQQRIHVSVLAEHVYWSDGRGLYRMSTLGTSTF